MRRTLMWVALFFVAGTGMGLAQDSYKESDNRAAWQNRWAMQFAVRSATLAQFNGATLSLRRHYGMSSAIRMGVSIGDIRRNESTRNAGGSTVSTEQNTAAVGLAFEYVRYVGAPSSVNLLWLLGPRTDYRWTHDVDRATTNHDWIGALQFGLGVEWFLHRRVSLSGEYVSELYYQRSEYQRSSLSTVNKSYGFRSGIVRFGVAVSL